MELRHLRYFVAVAQALNFTKAAARLHVAQPALSRQIRDLEQELGTPLLERGSRSVRLTPAGSVFLEEAGELLRRAESAVKAAQAAARGERGEIQVGYAPSPTVELLPCALHAFQNLAPEVRVNLHDLSSHEMVQGLREGSLHLSLLVQSPALAGNDLTFETLREYAMCVAVSSSHRLARVRQIRVEHIAAEPLIAYSRREYPEYHSQLTKLFEGCQPKPKIVEEHNSAPGLIAAVEIGKGLAIVPACMRLLIGGRLRLLRLQSPARPMQVGAAYDPRRLTLAARKFLDAARQASREQSKLGRSRD